MTLARIASGQMLQLFVTFKAKTECILKKYKAKENNANITTQVNGWMVYKLMMHWIRKVFVKYTKGHHALLLFDIFKGHLKEEVLTKLTESNTSYMIILGGCMSKIQLLDVCLNKPFKMYLRGAWEKYMVNQARRSSDA